MGSWSFKHFYLWAHTSPCVLQILENTYHVVALLTHFSPHWLMHVFYLLRIHTDNMRLFPIKTVMPIQCDSSSRTEGSNYIMWSASSSQINTSQNRNIVNLFWEERGNFAFAYEISEWIILFKASCWLSWLEAMCLTQMFSFLSDLCFFLFLFFHLGCSVYELFISLIYQKWLWTIAKAPGLLFLNVNATHTHTPTHTRFFTFVLFNYGGFCFPLIRAMIQSF